jgi:hypothetical protein
VVGFVGGIIYLKEGFVALTLPRSSNGSPPTRVRGQVTFPWAGPVFRNDVRAAIRALGS